MSNNPAQGNAPGMPSFDLIDAQDDLDRLTDTLLLLCMAANGLPTDACRAFSQGLDRARTLAGDVKNQIDVIRARSTAGS